MFRLLGIPILAVAGVFIYSGIRDRLVLPECDSDRAKKSLAEVLKEFKYAPTKYEPIKTVSATKDQVVCSAVLPLPDGGSVVADFHVLLARRQGQHEIFGGAQGADDSSITPPLRERHRGSP